MTEQTINKAHLVERLCVEHNIERTLAKEIVEEFFKIVLEQLRQGNAVKLPGLGNFSVREKSARPGRNLQTGEVVTINARRVVKFQPSGTLIDRVTKNLIQD